MTRKSITTLRESVACDVCGRTLLRGEQVDVYLAGGGRRNVCELCTPRAVHEGWIREGAGDRLDARRTSNDGRRSLLSRFRQRRERAVRESALRGRRTSEPLPPLEPAVYEEPAFDDDLYEEPVAAAAPAAPAPAPTPRPEPRNVHAVPSNAAMKVARAIELFNVSEHPRTVAGVARSLGAPLVSARPSAEFTSVVTIVVGWELSWYRYEIDLSQEQAGVRLTEQGAELDELPPEDQVANAVADEHGLLHPASA